MSDTTFSFQVDEQLKERFLQLAAEREVSAEQMIREFMQSVVQLSGDPEYDAWFREQVQIGLDQANAGLLIPSEEVEAEFTARRAEAARKLKRQQS